MIYLGWKHMMPKEWYCARSHGLILYVIAFCCNLIGWWTDVSLQCHPQQQPYFHYYDRRCCHFGNLFYGSSFVVWLEIITCCMLVLLSRCIRCRKVRWERFSSGWTWFDVRSETTCGVFDWFVCVDDFINDEEYAYPICSCRACCWERCCGTGLCFFVVQLS